MVKAIENSQSAILTALKGGSYYSSTGPDFHNVIWSDNQVDVSTSEISTIILQGKSTRTVVRHGTSMTHNTLPFEKLMPSPWLRLTIVDGAGKRAWTNPIWRNSLDR
jgi:hypothetical protein